MSNTFDKTRTQYERKLARQKQLEQMEKIATGEIPDDMSNEMGSITSAQSAPEGSKASRRSERSAPQGAIEVRGHNSGPRIFCSEATDKFGN